MPTISGITQVSYNHVKGKGSDTKQISPKLCNTRLITMKSKPNCLEAVLLVMLFLLLSTNCCVVKLVKNMTFV